MNFTLSIEDEMVVAEIERLRGKLSPVEFVRRCVFAGLRQAAAENAGNDGPPASTAAVKRVREGHIDLGKVEGDLGKLDAEIIVASLKSRDKKNPIYAAVYRLVAKYTYILTEHVRNTGRPMGQTKFVALAPIQRIALEAALRSLMGEEYQPPAMVTKH